MNDGFGAICFTIIDRVNLFFHRCPLSAWKHAEELKASAHFAILTRPRHNVVVPPGFSFQLVEGPTPDVSSTAVRSAQAGGATEEELALLVPREVAQFITATGLYA